MGNTLKIYKATQTAKYIMGSYCNNSKSPLHHACQYGYTTVVNTFLLIGVNIEEKDNLGRTLLHLACTSNCIESVILLLEAGADVEARDIRRETPLHTACARRYCRDDFVKLLIKKGSNIEATDYLFETPLHLACINNRDIETVKTLLDAGANINAKTYSGKTPLYFAICCNRIEIVKLLLEKNADVTLIDFDSMCYGDVKRIMCAHLLRKELNTNFGQHVPAVVDLCCSYL